LRLARDEPDRSTARILIGAARSNLGRIDQRFELPGIENDRTLLVGADGDLRRLQEALGSHEEKRLWSEWDRSWGERKQRLQGDEPRSLFSNALLRKL
jgi:hypothetical protein